MELPKYLHIASKDIVTRYEFALMLASVFGFDKKRLVPVKASELNWLAERPKNGGLKVDLAKKYGLHLYSILDGLQEYKNVSNC
jgi:dTDP-4-dehydrorhamnose reductase